VVDERSTATFEPQLVVLHSESSWLADDGHEHRDQHVAGDIVGAPRPDSRGVGKRRTSPPALTDDGERPLAIEETWGRSRPAHLPLNIDLAPT